MGTDLDVGDLVLQHVAFGFSRRLHGGGRCLGSTRPRNDTPCELSRCAIPARPDWRHSEVASSSFVRHVTLGLETCAALLSTSPPKPFATSYP